MTKSNSNRNPRLALNRETVRSLTTNQLGLVAGGRRVSLVDNCFYTLACVVSHDLCTTL